MFITINYYTSNNMVLFNEDRPMGLLSLFNNSYPHGILTASLQTQEAVFVQVPPQRASPTQETGSRCRSMAVQD